MFDNACSYLYYRREFDELLSLIRFEYDENKKQFEVTKSKLAKLKDSGNNDGSIRQIQHLEEQRDSYRNLRDDWFAKHVQFMQKINNISLFSHEKLVEKAEDYCTTKSDWILKESQTRWIECFKKSSNVDIKKKKVESDSKTERPPFISDKLLKTIQTKGGTRCSLIYLEYLTLKCNVDNRLLHTRYGSLLVQYIHSILRKKFPLEPSSNP